MHHNENIPRHYRYRDNRHYHERRRQHPEEEHFHDFGSRWGNHEPLIRLQHHPDHPEHMQPPAEWEHDARHPNEDWHDPRHNQYERPPQEPPIWRQQDVYFDRSNQRVEDRWYGHDSPMMPRLQQHERRRAPHPRDQQRRDERDQQ